MNISVYLDKVNSVSESIVWILIKGDSNVNKHIYQMIWYNIIDLHHAITGYWPYFCW